jgi:hypothetical protein
VSAIASRARVVSWVAWQAAVATPAWVCVAVAVAWVFLLAHGLAHGAHAHHLAMSPGAELLGWTAMVVAMMVPALPGNLRDVAQRSYRSRRQRAMAGYLVGYVAVWTVAGVPVLAVRAQVWSHDLTVAAIVFALAALWALLPVRARFVAACHRRIPLAPQGWRADRSALAQGIVTAIPCVATCGWMMLGCALTGHRLLPMLVGSGVVWIEMYQFRPDARPALAGAALLAAWCLLPLI